MARLIRVSRRSIAFFLALSALLLAFAPVAAFAGVPSPSNSTVPSCLLICPAGDRDFTVVVRDINNQPLPGTVVDVDLGNCPNAVIALCDECASASAYNALLRQFSGVTNANGAVTFHICGSIFCPGLSGNWVQVVASGVIIGGASFVTTDLDGDLDVDAQDVAIVTAAKGSNRTEADQDCSRGIDGDDVAAVEAHVGHACPGAVSSRAATWGKMKGLYR